MRKGKANLILSAGGGMTGKCKQAQECFIKNQLYKEEKNNEKIKRL